jgi:hypothetical protein
MRGMKDTRLRARTTRLGMLAIMEEKVNSDDSHAGAIAVLPGMEGRTCYLYSELLPASTTSITDCDGAEIWGSFCQLNFHVSR